MRAIFQGILAAKGFAPDRASLSARLFTEASLDGVYTHGVNRFERYVQYVDMGAIVPSASPKLVWAGGSLEQWDGCRGPGNLNAWFSMDRALRLAEEHGMGCVGLRNTNHWMRGGTYGWQAAEAGAIGICWTNTRGNLPPWGSAEPVFGNNPLVMALPRENGPLVLDMAMSMFSYGKLESSVLKNQELPFEGGFDLQGKLTRDPSAILASRRPVAIGYWKGTGMSVLLDTIAVLLSGGFSTRQITALGERETQVSQVFIALDAKRLPNGLQAREEIEATIDQLHKAQTTEPDQQASYPGERTLRKRKENTALGIPVEQEIWDAILALKV